MSGADIHYGAIISTTFGGLSVIAASFSAWFARRSRTAERGAEQKAQLALDLQVASVKAQLAAVKAEIATAAEVALLTEVQSGFVDAQASQLAADESKQATQIVFDATVWRGRPGWLVRNDSDSPVTGVEVRTTNGSPLWLYGTNNDPQQVPQYDEPGLRARRSTSRSFRQMRGPNAPMALDRSEIDELQVTFTDSGKRRWKRVGMEAPQTI